MTISIKTPEDIEKMRVAGRLASEVLDYITPFVKPGVTTEKLDTLCHDYMVTIQKTIPAPLNYAPPGYKPYPKSICTSVNHQVCHGVPGEKKLKSGDVVNIDVTVIKDGYHGDTSRMYYVGDPSIQAKRLCEITYECMWRGIEQVRPGNQLASDFERPEVLYLAGLFHDIAKGRSGDHSTLGKIAADRFCKRHALSAEDTKLVTWLVEHHLLMSSTAQKQDLSDPRVIAGFATHIANERYLVALYLLTVADIRATSPKVWNTWKSRLLEELFRATRQQLDGSTNHMDYSLENHKKKILTLLPPETLAALTHEKIWSELGSTYLLQHDPQEVAWHTCHLDRIASTPLPLVKARFAVGSEGLQVMIYIADQKDLFAQAGRQNAVMQHMSGQDLPANNYPDPLPEPVHLSVPTLCQDPQDAAE
ncbi:hypothetical protein B566_EDAN018635 [Ephemera danica]|nr:hypothetical protein B566_EDAN018635 [Ephemera danica]